MHGHRQVIVAYERQSYAHCTLWFWTVYVNGLQVARGPKGYGRPRAAWRAWDRFKTATRVGHVAELWRRPAPDRPGGPVLVARATVRRKGR